MSFEFAAIEVEGLSKCYHIYERPHDRLKQSLLPRFQSYAGRPPRRYYREFWALRNVSFEVGVGETVGIVGLNGSGKSTLLQMICGTLEPSEGRVETRGRIAALLELGAGFNPEFTGRENVFVNATVLGLNHREIEDRFDRIAAFADIGQFIEQPVKHYSSGMYARLAFAVAINVDASILIVDEALAVGDEPFQRKCFARIEKIKRDGGTILFVSHSGAAVINLCDRAILLHKGERLFTGTPKRAVFYTQKLGNTADASLAVAIEEIRQADVSAKEAHTEPEPSQGLDSLSSKSVRSTTEFKEFFDQNLVSQSRHAYEENGARIESARLVRGDGARVNHVLKGERYRLTCEVVFFDDCPEVRAYALIRTTAGIDLAGCAHPRLGEKGMDVAAGSTLRLNFDFVCSFNPATYFCNFAIQGQDGSLHHRIVDAFAFRVIADTSSSATGIVDVGFNAHVEDASNSMRQYSDSTKA